MTKAKRTVNTVRTKNFNTFLNEVCGKKKDGKLTQTELAEKLFMTKENLTRIKNGKVNLTDDNAQRIHDLFPKYRLEWLLGLDQWKTGLHYLLDEQEGARREANLLYSGLLAYSELCGVSITHRWEEVREVPKGENGLTFRDVFDNLYTLTWNGKQIDISLEEMNQLENEVYRFVKFRLMEYFDGEVK